MAARVAELFSLPHPAAPLRGVVIPGQLRVNSGRTKGLPRRRRSVQSQVPPRVPSALGFPGSPRLEQIISEARWEVGEPGQPTGGLHEGLDEGFASLVSSFCAALACSRALAVSLWARRAAASVAVWYHRGQRGDSVPAVTAGQ